MSVLSLEAEKTQYSGEYDFYDLGDWQLKFISINTVSSLWVDDINRPF